MATHRISVDVSGEEGVMYAGVPARRTREYEQWTPTPSVNQLVLSTPVNWYTIAPCMQHWGLLGTVGGLCGYIHVRHLGHLCGYSI